MLKRRSKLRFFAATGGFTGAIGGFALTIFMALSWPLVVSGKPIVSILPFMIIAFELTVLLGCILSFLGFLVLSGLPNVNRIVPKEEFGNQFVILIKSV
jgi:molybdopterin-containing oxidoreductase family membrane subunit